MNVSSHETYYCCKDQGPPSRSWTSWAYFTSGTNNKVKGEASQGKIEWDHTIVHYKGLRHAYEEKKKIKIHFHDFKKTKKLNIGPIFLFLVISRINKINIWNLGNLDPRNRILKLMHDGLHLQLKQANLESKWITNLSSWKSTNWDVYKPNIKFGEGLSWISSQIIKAGQFVNLLIFLFNFDSISRSSGKIQPKKPI